MIKTFIILLLLGALIVGSAITRPSFDSFKAWHKSRVKPAGGNFVEKVFHDTYVNGYLDECKYKNRLLWADIEFQGKIVATGVFNHWVARTAKPAEPQPAK